jgi:hypothetical protein
MISNYHHFQDETKNLQGICTFLQIHIYYKMMQFFFDLLGKL